METVAVSLNEDSYSIYIQEGILNHLADYCPKADKWFVITDKIVEQLYGDKIKSAIQNYPYSQLILSAGEKSKTMHTVETIICEMLTAGLTRNSMVIAIGGGVIGDIAGFCASVFMRGIRFMQIPTTLLAQVDSSIGGKTGVNVKHGKNMAGTFHHPEVVLIDTALLTSLSQREFNAGLGEVIKYGLIYDAQLLQYIEENFTKIHAKDFNILNILIKQCCEIKAKVVSFDEQEAGLRKILNFGHTFGHAIETLTNYAHYLHGEAVLVGMYYESLMAYKLGLISGNYLLKITNLIQQTGVSLKLNGLSLSGLISQMRIDKKNKNDIITFILPIAPGVVGEFCLTPPEVNYLLTS